MKCTPIGSAVDSCATPPESGAVPRSVPPSRNATDPVGVTPPASVTTAAPNVTPGPKAVRPLLGNAKVNVDCARSRTVTPAEAEVLAAKLPPPWYVAVNACAPGASRLMVSVAIPPELAAVPTGVAPSKNVTVPAGALAP